jgi:hypothetical protein
MNYWQLLARAEEELAAGRLRSAETTYREAVAARQGDTRQVLLSETIPDGMLRVWRRLRRREAGGPGRWQARVDGFVRRYADAAAGITRRADVQRDLAAGADPHGARDLLEEALFLAVDSRLVTCPLAASDLLVALMRLTPETGRLPDLDLVPAPAVMAASVRLELAELASAGLAAVPAVEARPWAERLLELLDAADAADATDAGDAGDAGASPGEDDGTRETLLWSPRLQPRRLAAAADLADRHLEDPRAVLARWTACDVAEVPPARRRLARLRRVELLAGCDRRRPDVPDIAAARELARGFPRQDDALDVRLEAAHAAMDYRSPATEPARSWCSAAAAPDGSIRFVSWWGDCPRDVARWRPGTPTAPIAAFVDALAGRLVWSGDGPPPTLVEAWAGDAPGRALAPLAELLLEPLLPADGWNDDLARGLALARSGPWRQDWRPDLGVAVLAPPGQDGRLGERQQPLAGALQAGLLWLAMRHRLDQADPALRAGIGELGRRGNRSAAFLHDLAVLGAPDRAAVDAGFAPWTLPLLWTRPDPLRRDDDDPTPLSDRPDLAGQDVTVVVGGRPGAIMRAWGDRDERWRVVLDRFERLAELVPLARDSFGPVTVVPPGGRPHRLDAALAHLDALVAGGADLELLALCHWLRLVETHNGDLLDVRIVRPRAAGVCPLLDRYAELVAELPTEAPGLGGEGWGAQYGQRVRRSGLVTGRDVDLDGAPEVLDVRWGVYDGSDASWVFLDSAAVHWRLLADHDDDHLARLHGVLAARGRRHLSLVTSAALFPDDLAAWFETALAGYGRPYHATIPDDHGARLRLAGEAPLPGSLLQVEAPFAASLATVAAMAADTAVLTPATEPDHEFWQAAAAGEFGDAEWCLAGTPAARAARRLVVPRLAALEEPQPVQPVGDDPVRWADADRRRTSLLAGSRRRAALEVAALLAGRAALVEILDSRWWRWLEADVDGAAEALARVRGAEEVSLAAPSADLAAAVRAWLAARGRVAGAGATDLPADLAGRPAVAESGLHLHQGDPTGLWADLAAATVVAWEAGRPLRRLLVIGASPPPGMAALVAHLASPRASSLAAAGVAATGPLVWVRAQELVARLRDGEDVGRHDAVLLLDLEQFLPGGGGDEDAGADVLRWLAQAGAPRIDLVGGALGPAWSSFLGERLGGAIPTAADRPGGWARLRRGALPRTVRRCPRCAAEAPGAASGLACAACGLDLAWSAPATDRTAEVRGCAEALLAQVDLGREHVLEIWGDADALASVRTLATDHGATADAASPLRLQLPDGRRWRLDRLDAGARAGSPRAVLLQAPAGPQRLRPQAPAGAEDDSELMLCYDALELRRLETGAPPGGVERLLEILGDERAIVSGAPGAGRPGTATVMTWHLAWLSGLPEAAVRRLLADLRWTSRLLDGGPPPTTTDRPAALRVQVARRQMEMQVGGLADHVRGQLTAVLSGSQRGERFELQVAAQGADDDLLVWQADRLLALLADASWQQAWSRSPGLLYAAPDGAWFGATRRLGRVASVATVVDAAAAALDAFAAWCDDLLTGSSLVDTGYVVSSPQLVDPVHRAWIVLGQQLGFWTASPAVGPDVVTLAEIRENLAPVVGDRAAPGRELLLALDAGGRTWRQRLAATPAGGALAGAPLTDVPPPQRRWWRRDRHDPLADARRRVADLLAAPADRTLVLSGVAGTGRLRALLGGLAASATGLGAEIWCPDIETAARVHLTARGVRASWRPWLRVTAGGPGPDAVAPRAPAEVRPVVLVEAQRFPRDLRYRLQEAGRQAGLLMTVDPVDVVAGESWEDLFVVTPRREDVVRMQLQLDQARQPWELAHALGDPGDADPRAARREQGLVEARRAETIDECAAAIASARAAGRLADHVLVVAPHAEDVDLLGRALADRGWATARRASLAPLLMPGVTETLAACADVHRRHCGQWPGDDAAGAGGTPLLPAMLGADDGRQWREWIQDLPASVREDGGEFLAWWRRSPWGEVATGAAPARRQFAAWSVREGGPAACLEAPVWRVWRHLIAGACTRPDLAPTTPTAVLATAAEPASWPTASVAYVCFGSEPAAVHRRSVAQATDRLLILYQERSPLPGDAEHGAGS